MLIVGGAIAVCLCAAVFGLIGVGLLGASVFSIAGVQTTVNGPVVVATAYIPLPAQVIPTSTGPTPTGAPTGTTLSIPTLGVQHVPEGTTVTYNSDPPTSGPHYPTPLPAGFYTDTVPDGYVVHSMEHGYVVIWYDCATLADADCQTLQDDIEGLITNSTQSKLIALPRSGMQHPIALTSWGKLAFLDQFDETFINQFITDNILKSPEPSGP